MLVTEQLFASSVNFSMLYHVWIDFFFFLFCFFHRQTDGISWYLICFAFEELFEKAFSKRFPEVAFHSKFHNPDSVEDACPYLLHLYLSSH